MNREILFRGKTIETKRWAYGYYCKIGNKAYIVLDDAELCEDEQGTPDNAIFGFIEVDPDTVGQFTGYPDKYGKKIFSGDIVKVWLKKYESVCLPTFRHGIIEYVYDAYWIIPIGRRASWRCLRNRPIEIIGNKWDNPELMEQ